MSKMDVKPAEIKGSEPQRGDFPDHASYARAWRAYKGFEVVEAEPAPKHASGTGRKRLKTVLMSDVTPETMTFLWYPYLPKRYVSLIDGDPGVGKSYVSLAIAAIVSTGKAFPGKTGKRTAARVLMCSVEDGLGDAIRPRLDGLKADVGLIRGLKEKFTLDDEGVRMLDVEMEEWKPALVVIDPIVAFTGGKKDLHRANQVREIMAPLGELAAKHDCCILVIRHMRKADAVKAIHAGAGSVDFTAAVRSQMIVAFDENEKPVLAHSKANNTPLGASWGYEIVFQGEGSAGKFRWTGPVDIKANQLVQADAGKKAEHTSAQNEAMTFLSKALRGGPKAASDMQEWARAEGITAKTLKRAKAKLEVISRQHLGPDGKNYWTWELPEAGGHPGGQT